MRIEYGEYLIDHSDFSTLTEVDLLRHYFSPDLPRRDDYHRIRIIAIEVGEASLQFENEQIHVRSTSTKIGVSCTCSARNEGLCRHEITALSAILYLKNLRVFFDKSERLHLLKGYAERYGLQHESDLDSYFELQYDLGSVRVAPLNEGILPVDQENLLPIRPNTRVEVSPSKHRIIVIKKHPFYHQLRFELVDAEQTASGKLKAPFDVVSANSVLWKINDPDAIKFYVAIDKIQNSYNEEYNLDDLIALHAIVKNPLQLPFYKHLPDESKKYTNRALQPTSLKVLQAEIEISVFKKEPFYEVTAELVWDEQRLPMKYLSVQQKYFLRRDNDLFLLPNEAFLSILDFFKKNAEIVLVHQNKYEDFVQHTLQPLENSVKINYSYIRSASSEEAAPILNNRERIIYLSQEGAFISMTPVVRYGEVEIPIATHRVIRTKDANGNIVTVQRDIPFEDKFRQLLLQQHQDFPTQLHEMDYFYLHHQQFLDGDWFIQAFDCWKNEGLTVLGFQDLKVTKINPYKAKVDIKIISGTDWFNTKISVSYDRQSISTHALHKAIKNKSRYVELSDGTLGILPEEWIERIAAFFKFGTLEKDTLKIAKTQCSALDELLDDDESMADIKNELAVLKQRLATVKTTSDVAVPTTLQTTLRPYQRQGLGWLNGLDELNFGGCLADDMGLGKTVQIIAYLLLQKGKHPNQPNLIIAPTSLLFNWKNEIQRFAPSLQVELLHGTDRQSQLEQHADVDVVLSTYGNLVNDISWLKKHTFNAIILDEAQAIKNPNAERNKAARLLQARIRFVLTGTPIENNTYDLYGQLSFACPGLLGSPHYFRDTFATPIDRFQDSDRTAALHTLLSPFILRRTKAQVAQELPEKTEINIYCEMGESQRDIYDAREGEFRDYLNGIQKDELERDDFQVLAGLTRLRQICNAPVLLKEGHDSRISCKIDAILEQLSFIGKTHKVLIFSQFVEMLDLIKHALQDNEIRYEYLTGATKNREKVVDNFQQNPDIQVFLISLKAGGVGLNLTAADYVFLVDPWWNPAIEQQAIDRSHRIGQDKPVVAVRFICQNTVEEKIQKIQDRKKSLAGRMIRTDQPLDQKQINEDWWQLVASLV